MTRVVAGQEKIAKVCALLNSFDFYIALQIFRCIIEQYQSLYLG